ncbi:TetR/AcrR family transcriptional regulator [Streptomyces sp. SP18CS02]|uniref:TetR/AcrR family transcriptional regulator n=1 Tax=Streptomyces sp. SP18CS02 TaxID=3002531 RepID=UPI002E776E0F|nr:TetR/AcrR family transcriptional regulator [Streptomyces sp. SP18CS02]MEE1757042.1 TetR/AcrR family transcriptional regulator [Streptomyces sp. SP18CS02]
MGHREALLEGAKRCLLEKGYARTTARDIVAASGTNLASIGYHYGSKEALLNQAFLAVTEERGEAAGPAGAREVEPSADPYERFRQAWGQLIATAGDDRAVWKLQLEAVTRLDEDEELREALKEQQREGRLGMARMFPGPDPEADPEKTRVAGLLCQALAAGVMIQRMVDPDSAPSAEDLAEGLKVLMGETG